MAKVSYMVGFTLNINPAKNEYMRQTVEVHDIDTDGDVLQQLESTHAALHQLMKWADQTLLEKIEKEAGKEFVDKP